MDTEQIVIQWQGAHQRQTALVAGAADLADSLAKQLPVSTLTSNAPGPVTTIVADRGAVSALPDAVLRDSRRVILLDPTDDDRRRSLQALAGNPAARLTSLPSLSTISTAEHALLLMLALSRNLFHAYSDIVSGQRSAGSRSRLTDKHTTHVNWTDTEPPVPLHQQTLGIIGLGRVGEALASRAVSLGMTVIYHDPVAKPATELRHGLARRRFDQVLREADVVSLHLPLTTETVRIIDAPELALMKPSAILINTAHGRIVDEGSLIKALHTGDIAGAGLDVFAYEPLPANSPLLRLDNVVLTPHLAGATDDEDRQYLTHQAAQILRDQADHGSAI